MTPTFFPTPSAFRKWLQKHHNTETELIVGFYKVGTGKKSITWSQAVDQALCFGWIDGVRRSVDGESYCNRFTPRRKNSNWSEINIKKVEELIKTGAMTPAGLKVFEGRKENSSEIYSYLKVPGDLDNHYKTVFKKNKEAWNFFNEQSATYKKLMIHWIMSAKQEKTRLTRLEKMIKISGEKKRMI